MEKPQDYHLVNLLEVINLTYAIQANKTNYGDSTLLDKKMTFIQTPGKNLAGAPCSIKKQNKVEQI